MGFKGKPRARGDGIAKGLGRTLQTFGGRGMTGQPGKGKLFRVRADGSIVEVTKPRRKKGVRLPRWVNELLRENIELSKDVRRVMILQTVPHGGGCK